MQALLGDLIDSIVAFPGEFADVAAHDPVSALLLVVGTVLLVVSMGVFGYLSLGALLDFVTPDLSGRSPPRADR